MSGPLFFGLFDWWAAHIINLIHGGSGPEPGGPGIFGVLEWTAVFVGILIAFFWEGIGEGIGGAIVALVALAMQADVIVNAGGGLNPFIPVFVFEGLAFVFCWWRTRHQSLSTDTSASLPTPTPERGIRLHLWDLGRLLVVIGLLAALVWRVVVYLQPPPPPPADCGQPKDAARSGAVAQFCFLNLSPQLGQGSMTAGPDGSVWFKEGRKIARITPAGALTEFPVPPPDLFITAGPDDNLWFSGMGPKIVRMSTHGDVREFALPKQSHDPAPLIVGPDGNLWFTEGQGVGKFAKMTLVGEITEFSLPFEVRDLAPASDGNLWFVGDSTIGRITSSGVVTLFPLPLKAQVGALAAGPDGRVWFLRSDTDMSGIYWWTQIGCITP